LGHIKANITDLGYIHAIIRSVVHSITLKADARYTPYCRQWLNLIALLRSVFWAYELSARMESFTRFGIRDG